MAAPRMPCACHWVLLLVLTAAALIVAAAGARQAEQLQVLSEQPPSPSTAQPSHNQQALMTYFFDVTKPVVQLLPASQGSGRPGRTPLRVTLPGAASVSSYMPVISPRATGMTHQVVKTWQALTNYALMFARVNTINAQATGAGNASPHHPRLFPRPSLAVGAAADTAAPAAAAMDVAAIIDAAEAAGQRGAWTETSPGSMLLMPFGQSVAAVADIMGITHNEASGAITLDLDLVLEPNMVSEFQAHGPQTLDAKTSHFHFYLPDGVKVDAARLLKVLQESRDGLEGLHMFAKLGLPCYYAVLSQAASPDNAGYIRVTARLTADCTYEGRLPGAGNASQPTPGRGGLTCFTATFSWTGDATVGPASICPTRTETEAQAGAPARRGGGANAGQDFDFSSNTHFAWIDLKPQCSLQVWLSRAYDSYTLDSGRLFTDYLTIPGPACGPSKLLLAPDKAYRHVHERVALTIQALGDDNTGVAGVPIALAAEGDCDPDMVATTTTTDSNGQAIAYVTAHEPGALAVVVAATSGSGVRLVTPPAHIIFIDEHEYVEEEKERQYHHGRDHNDRYADRKDDEAAAYIQRAQPDDGSDAARFAARATQRALAQLPAA